MSSRFKTLLFSLTPCVLLLLGIELGERIVYYQRHSSYSAGILQFYRAGRNWAQRLHPPKPFVRPAISADGPLFQADPILGYKTIPGAHAVTYTSGSRKLVARIRIGADGYRVTSVNPGSYLGKPELWFFGCSYTWGESLNDEDTFPWRMQQAMPEWRVRNLAMGGYGDLQGLLELETAVRNKDRLPRIAIFVYDDFHKIRNVGAPSWLKRVQAATPAPDTAPYTYPRGSISPEGNFTVEYVPLRESSWMGIPDPPEWYRILITKIVIFRIFELCAAHGITAVFAAQTPLSADPVADYARQTGFQIADLSVDLNVGNSLRYRSMPFDIHPNAAASLEYHRLLLPVVRRLAGQAGL